MSVSVYENEILIGLFSKLIIIFIFIEILINYMFTIAYKNNIIEGFRIYNNLEMYFSYERFYSLQEYDGFSGVVYMFCSAISIFFGSICGFLLSYFYYVNVILEKRMIDLKEHAFLGLVYTFLFCSAVIWLSNFMSLNVNVGGYLGMSYIFVSPVFQIFSAMSSTAIMLLVFTIVGTLLKIVAISKREKQ